VPHKQHIYSRVLSTNLESVMTSLCFP